MTERIIKKYENRRLYDTEESRYINQEAVHQLILDGQDVKVVDAKTGEDLTRHVMTQIIVEGAKDPEGGPPVEFLRDLIRTTDRANRDFLHWYLGTAQQVYQKMQDGFRSAGRKSPLHWQKEAWVKMLDPLGAVRHIMKADSASEEDSEVAETATAENEDTAEELAELKKRLEELEQRLGQAGGR